MFRRRRKDEDFAAEIQAHLDLENDRLREEGRPGVDARRAFGNAAAAQERFYESRRYMWIEHLWRDVRCAAGTLRRSPAFTVAAIVSLALGIGANTAIFSAIDEILLRPLAVPQPDQLAQVYSFNRKTATYVSTSYPDYADFRRRAQSFQQLSAYVRLPLNVELGGQGTERVTVEAVSGNYFDMLKIPPLAGRTLRADDDEPGAPAAAIVSEELWRTRFHAAPGLVGKSIRIEGHPFSVAGIVPNRFSGMNLNWATPPRLWIALHTTPLVLPGMGAANVFDNRAALWLVLTGRLKPGVSAAGAQAELRTIALAAVGLYSLVAYSVLQRTREIGIRIAIGAQPRSVLAGILRKSMRLTAAGLVLGGAGSLLLMRYLATQVKDVSLYDGLTYLLVALVLVSVTGVAALIPARRAMAVDPAIALRGD